MGLFLGAAKTQIGHALPGSCRGQLMMHRVVVCLLSKGWAETKSALATELDVGTGPRKMSVLISISH